MRTLMIAMFSFSLMATACKKKENEAGKTEAAKPADTTGSAPAGSAPATGTTGDMTTPTTTDTTATSGAGAASGDMEKQGEELMDKMVAVFKDSGEDCDKLGDNLKTFMGENKDKFKALAEWSKTQTAEQKKAWDEKNKAKTEEMQKAMMPAMQKCSSNAKVQEAMKEMAANMGA